MAEKDKSIDISKLNLEGLEEPISDLDENNPNSGILTDEEAALASEEALNEQEYGDSPLTAAAAGAARGLTFGVSDQALTKSGLVEEKTLRELKNRNPEASVAGELGAIAGSALLSGGITGAAGAGIRAAGATGRVAENLAAKGVSKLLKEGASKSLAKKILEKSVPQAAGAAVESTFYTTGQLISEDALGEADFNAENLIATLGPGAILAGAVGGAIGTAGALVPVVKKGKVVGYAKKKIKEFSNPNEAAWTLAGSTPVARGKIKNLRPEVYENGANFLQKRAGIKVTDGIEEVYSKSKDQITSIGEEIDNIVSKIDDVAEDYVAALPTKQEFSQRMVRQLDELIPSDSISLTSKRNKSLLDRQVRMLQEFGKQEGRITAKDLRRFKTEFQKNSKYGYGGALPFENEINRELSKSFRNELFNVADNLDPINKELSSALKKANLDYGTAVEMTKFLEKKSAREAAKQTFGSLKDYLFADVILGTAGAMGAGNVLTKGAALIGAKKFLESDLRRKLQVLSSVEKANQKVSKNIGSSIAKFMSEKTRAAAKPTSFNILAKSTFAKKDLKKKPKDKKEAIQNLYTNLEELSGNPEKMLERITINTLRFSKAAPQTAAYIQQVATAASNFLQSKLPRQVSNRGALDILKPKYVPSSLEVAKFERYLEAIEEPLSILKDLETNSLTREKVEAVQAVYPQLYQQIQEKTMDALAKQGEDVPYKKRIQLGILLDIPSDISLIPENIAALQRQFVAGNGKDNTTAAVNPTVGGLKELSLAEDNMSETEKIATRE